MPTKSRLWTWPGWHQQLYLPLSHPAFCSFWIFSSGFISHPEFIEPQLHLQFSFCLMPSGRQGRCFTPAWLHTNKVARILRLPNLSQRLKEQTTPLPPRVCSTNVIQRHPFEGSPGAGDASRGMTVHWEPEDPLLCMPVKLKGAKRNLTQTSHEVDFDSHRNN